MNASSGPSVQRFRPDAVLLQGIAVHDCRTAMKVYLRALKERDGIYPIERLVATWRVLDAAAKATSAIVAAETPEDAAEESLGTEELLTTKETAAMLRLSDRQTRNLAGDLGARLVGRFLFFPADAVEAEARRRAESRAA
jgi:hypothetical protein